MYEIGAADDDVAHNADEALDVHVAVFFMEHRGNNVRAACGKAKAKHRACTDAHEQA